MTRKRKYRVRTFFTVNRRPVHPGDHVELHPRVARYLLGTHLEPPGPRPATPQESPQRGKD